MDNLENMPLRERLKLKGFIVTDRVSKLMNSNRMIIDKNGNDVGYMSPSECFKFIKEIEKNESTIPNKN